MTHIYYLNLNNIVPITKWITFIVKSKSVFAKLDLNQQQDEVSFYLSCGICCAITSYGKNYFLCKTSFPIFTNSVTRNLTFIISLSTFLSNIKKILNRKCLCVNTTYYVCRWKLFSSFSNCRLICNIYVENIC